MKFFSSNEISLFEVKFNFLGLLLLNALFKAINAFQEPQVFFSLFSNSISPRTLIWVDVGSPRATSQCLTLLRPGRGTLCQTVTYLRTTVQIHVQACWKNLTFPNYDSGKRQYAFYPTKYLVSGRKKKFGRCTKILNWVKRKSKIKRFQKLNIIWGIQTSWILLNMVFIVK